MHFAGHSIDDHVAVLFLTFRFYFCCCLTSFIYLLWSDWYVSVCVCLDALTLNSCVRMECTVCRTSVFLSRDMLMPEL